MAGLSALAQESRLEIFRLLMERWPDGLPAGTIAEMLSIPATTLSFHLSQLSGAKLVESRKEGRSVIYTASMKRAKKLAKFISRKPEAEGIEGDSAKEQVAEQDNRETLDEI